MKILLRLTVLVMLSMSAGAALLGACATTSAPAYPLNDTYKPDAATVFRAKITPCLIDSQCEQALVTPRCGSETFTWCDLSQPNGTGRGGICVFTLPGVNHDCPCYEGDIRYCDLQGPGSGSCQQNNLLGCGIQTCLKADDGGIPPGPTWGTCVPQVGPPGDAGVADSGAGDGGDAGSADSGPGK